MEIVCNNSPEFWSLFVEKKAREGRAKTSKADLIVCWGWRGGPEPHFDRVALISAFRLVQPRVLAIRELWKTDLELS